jgi:hypothetical protein
MRPFLESKIFSSSITFGFLSEIYGFPFLYVLTLRIKFKPVHFRARDFQVQPGKITVRVCFQLSRLFQADCFNQTKFIAGLFGTSEANNHRSSVAGRC